MKEFVSILRHTELFEGLSDEDISAVMICLHAGKRVYKRGEYVHRSGERIHRISLLASGTLLIQKDDYWGNRSIIHQLTAGEMFGEAYAMQDSEPMLNDVVALVESTVLSFDAGRLLTGCSGLSGPHALVIQNLMRSLSAKNRLLTQKIDYMARRTTREKLTAYLSAQSKKQGTASFEIPFNRQQLADFLGIDRSAMSRELCRMRDDGMLRFHRSRFTLIQREAP